MPLPSTTTPTSPTAHRPRWRSPLVPGVVLVLIGLLTWQVVSRGAVLRVDDAVRRHVLAAADASPGWVGGLADVFIRLGEPESSVPACAVVVAVVAWRVRSWRLVGRAGVLLAFLAVIPVVKVVIGRSGPGEDPDYRPPWYGYFPSGHTATTGLCLGVAAFALLALAPRSRRCRRLVVAVWAALTVLVGVALVWNDDHWASDVVGSWLITVLAVWTATRIGMPVASTDEYVEDVGSAARGSGDTYRMGESPTRPMPVGDSPVRNQPLG